MKNEQPTAVTRRAFLRTAATLTAAGLAAPHLALAATGKHSRRPPPSGRIHVGLIGCGGMGRANLGACAGQPDVVVTGACDVWESRRNAVAEQFKDTCKGYRDFRELLRQQDLDAVIIATPPHWHALIAIAACEAGKDIYLQKPMTLHLAESLAVRNAVKKHNCISQVGTQIHAGENYRRVVEFIRSGNLGPIGVVRAFNVMNQHPQGVGTATQKKAPEGIGLGSVVRPGAAARVQQRPAPERLSPVPRLRQRHPGRLGRPLARSGPVDHGA